MNTSEFKSLLGNSSELTLDTTLTLDEGIYDACGATIIAKRGIFIGEDNVCLKNATVIGSIKVEGHGVSIINCSISAENKAIFARAAGLVLKNNHISCGGIAIALESGSYNCLVAQNRTDGEIEIRDGYNCSVILNEAEKISALNNKNVYIIDNSAKTLSLCNNNHIICDGNKFESLADENNQNKNGNSLMDVDARLEVGADRNLLPHTDKDLFIGMTVSETIKDAELECEMVFSDYLPTVCEKNDVVIVAPGAYRTATIQLTDAHSNTKIYAYGVYVENLEYDSVLVLRQAENITVAGLTMGYKPQSAHQIHVLEVGEDYITAVTAAGLAEESTDRRYQHTLFSDIYPRGSLYTESVKINDDGTMTWGVSADHIHKLRAGDVLNRRVGRPGESSVYTEACSGIVYKDVVLYGQSSALAFAERDNLKSVVYYRIHNTNRAPYIIDEKTYQFYKALEEKYGVCLEVSIDHLGRYRGSIPRVGSVDATHIMRCKKGITAISCIFEQMCDDGSNHRASSSRLAECKDNGDGTTTLVYKPNLAEVYYIGYQRKDGSSCPQFEKGDQAYLYTSKGQLVCDTPALDDCVFVGTGVSELTGAEYEKHAIKVKTEAVNFAALEGYDLSDDHYRTDNKVLVDNTSHNSQGFYFDNVWIEGIRSRGFMVKAPNGTIKNCTFCNLNMAGIACKTEITWSESTVAHDINISKNLFNNTSFANDQFTLKRLAPIVIEGFSNTVQKDFLIYKNITIEGNRFENVKHKYGICINSAENVKIIGNTFCPIVGEDPENLGISIDIDTAMDVEISGNTFSPNSKTPLDAICARNYKNVYGTDVSDKDGNRLLPDSVE